VWNRLLHIPAGGAARIALYKGETELVAWLRAFANRFFLALVSQPKASPPALEDAILLHSAGNATLALDPELVRVKQSYLPGLRATLGHTLTSLEARERALLHEAIVEQEGLVSLSLLYAMPREALVSVLDGARAKLEYRVKNRLGERMKISDRDHASLVRCLGIQLDAALSRTKGS
jgi:RNA polymerase sigma-70 factor